MKYCSLIVLFVCMCLIATAQDNEIIIRGTNKVSVEYTPQQVIDSLNHRFPDAKSVEYYKVDPSTIKKGWQVSEDDELGADRELNYYTISFKRDDLKYYGLYSADGKLLMYKYEQDQASLPDAVKTSLKKLAGDDYKKYTLLNSSYFKTVNENKQKEYYEVTAVKGNTKKRIFVKPDGTVIKVK